MRLSEYWRGIPVTLTAPLAPDAAARKIDAAAGSVLSPFATGIVGRAGAGRVRLGYRPSIFSYNARPLLTGRILPDRAGARLELAYRGPVLVRLMFPLLVLIILAAGVAIAASGGLDAVSGLLIGLTPLVGLVLALAAHAFLIRNAETELALLIDFLKHAIGAEEVRGSRLGRHY